MRDFIGRGSRGNKMRIIGDIRLIIQLVTLIIPGSGIFGITTL